MRKIFHNDSGDKRKETVSYYVSKHVFNTVCDTFVPEIYINISISISHIYTHTYTRIVQMTYNFLHFRLTFLCTAGFSQIDMYMWCMCVIVKRLHMCAYSLPTGNVFLLTMIIF